MNMIFFRWSVIIFSMITLCSCESCGPMPVVACGKYRGSDLNFIHKNGVSEYQKRMDIRDCVINSCPESIKKYEIPDKDGNYIAPLHKIYGFHSNVGYNCVRNAHICLNNKGYEDIQ